MSLPSTHSALVVNADASGWAVAQQALPAFDDLLVKVHAAALNPTDWQHVLHPEWKSLAPGTSTGSDFAGVVVAARDGAQYKIGERVAGFTRGGVLQKDNGAFAEYIAAQSPIVWRIPEHITFAQAAAVGGIPGDTAAQALYTRLDLPRPWAPAQRTAAKAGDAILIWSGAASVSYYAIQLAKLAGLKVYTTASPQHHAHLTALGADAVFDYRDPEVAQKLQAASGGSIRIALDGVSTPESLRLTAAALGAGGTLVSLLGPPEGAFPAHAAVVPTFIYSVLTTKNAQDRADIAEWHKVLPELLESGKLRPHKIDVRHGLEGISEGLLQLMDGKVSGKKIVHTIGE
ncbi:hypothetical protein HWV62_18732 [Athelia sp. TMB]|nr:hypothetical protein HWV62_18732 [Athelia sp. TMB]